MGIRCKCTKTAFDSLVKLEKKVMDGPYNIWEYKGKRYYYLIGREQKDGSITGSVKEVETKKAVGNFKVKEDGKIVRFSKVPKKVLKAI